jgi:hypothetical protein
MKKDVGRWVNRMCHAFGQRHAARIRDRIKKEIATKAEGGKKPDEFTVASKILIQEERKFYAKHK